MSDIAEFENMMSLDQPLQSTKLCRWERKQRQGEVLADRFIPNRSAMEKSLSQPICENENPRNDDVPELSEHAKLLAAGTSDNTVDPNTRVLAYKNKAPAPKDGYQNSLKVLYSQQAAKKVDAKPTRHIASAPIRILDAPDLLDDYYLNLLSWSCNNILAIALAQTMYLWDASTGSIKELMNLPGDEEYISSVSWIQQGGTHIALGTSSNTVQLWDVQAQKQVRTMRGHSARVGCLAWNNHLIASGSRDTSILNHDVRIQEHIVGRLQHHTQEVCGLAWSPDGAYLASGANDNTLCIFDAASTSTLNGPARHILTDHQAAVKALAWSPHERNLLATGGGTADRCIKFWNAKSGTMLNSVDTGSQVCALQWSPFEKELLSSHGYAENKLCLWNYPSMTKTKELRGHTSRILHLATSPDGSMVCSAAADETLRFWNVFAPESNKRKNGDVCDFALAAKDGALNRASKNLKIRAGHYSSVILIATILQ